MALLMISAFFRMEDGCVPEMACGIAANCRFHSFMPKRGNGINVGRLPCRSPTRQQGNRKEQE